MASEKIEFTAERETALLTLYGKAIQSRSADPVLPDPWAEDVIARVNYNFDKLKVRKYESRIMAVRAKEFDVLTGRFLDQHRESVVVQLGCGLDSRVFRVDPPQGTLWYDIDFVEVIELRRRLYSDRSGYTMLGTAIESTGWVESIPIDRPTLVLAEGVTMYLTEAIIKDLLDRLTNHFKSGTVVFDAWSGLSLKSAQRRGIKGTGATFGWSIDDPETIRQLAPELFLVEEITARRLTAYDKLPWWSRLLVSLTDRSVSLRRANRILVYQF